MPFNISPTIRYEKFIITDIYRQVYTLLSAVSNTPMNINMVLVDASFTVLVEESFILKDLVIHPDDVEIVHEAYLSAVELLTGRLQRYINPSELPRISNIEVMSDMMHHYIVVGYT